MGDGDGPPLRPDVTPRSVARSRPQKTAIIVAAAIVDRITAQGLHPGHVLPAERVLMEEYDVGRGTMREALRYLELQGVLTIKPGPKGGPVVAAPDSRHLASTFALLMQFAGTSFGAVIDARRSIEPVTASLAATQATSSPVGDQLLESVTSMEADLGDWDHFLDENRRFHDLVAWGSGNPIFGYLVNSLHWITDGTVLGIDYPLRFRRAVLDAHRRVAEAVKAADPEASHAAMTDHMEDTRRYFERRYPQVLDQQLKWEQFGGA
ncbi:FadR/GntR family transcriptional regulator [Euzebya sp.]|uniref:FadR/GntR family transcriptional regulator n=1 Tax=Euzebya sp. TaxID=1971409 RepID=UPI0035135B00